MQLFAYESEIIIDIIFNSMKHENARESSLILLKKKKRGKRLEIKSMIRQRIDVIRLSAALSSIAQIIGSAVSRNSNRVISERVRLILHLLIILTFNKKRKILIYINVTSDFEVRFIQS